MTTGDFNADGKLDLATANQNSDNVSVLLGDGMGGFTAPVNFGAGDGAVRITTGDFNADGQLDLAAANVWLRQRLGVAQRLHSTTDTKSDPNNDAISGFTDSARSHAQSDTYRYFFAISDNSTNPARDTHLNTVSDLNASPADTNIHAYPDTKRNSNTSGNTDANDTDPHAHSGPRHSGKHRDPFAGGNG